MTNWEIILISSLVFGVTIADESDKYKVTNTSYGPVKGIKLLSQYEEKEYYSYRGIPFAKPPVGELRFKPPIAHDGWKDPLEALEFGNACPQVVQVGLTNYWGDEDCLTINIYAPANARKAAVMFFIHGGGYVDGSGNDFFYGPDFLINEDVILVTTNYRLGPLGFMSLGTPEVAGNMGLKDMIFSLKWVNENIENFGGDPRRITIFGESSGGAATHLLTFSPKTRNLFKRAILMSGCAFNPFALGPNNTHTATAYKLAESMGHPVDNYQDLLKILQTSDAKDLITKSVQPDNPAIHNGIFEFKFAYDPIVDKRNAPDAVFPNHPTSYVGHRFRNNIDLMFGHNTAESLFHMPPIVQDPLILKEFDEKFIISLPRREFLLDDYNSTAHINARTKVREYYFGTEKINRDQLEKLINLTSDIIFRYGNEKAVELEARRSRNTYYYSFSGTGALNAFTVLLNLTELGIPKPSHADELCYLFACDALKSVYPTLTPESKERQMIKNMASTFANFAKEGKPKSSNWEVDWKPVKRNEINMVELGSNNNIPLVNPLKDMKDFWDGVLYEYKRNSSPCRFTFRTGISHTCRVSHDDLLLETMNSRGDLL